MSITRPSLAQRVAALLLLLYCGTTTVLALPEEVVPAGVHTHTQATRAWLDTNLGINPWHFVFPGRRDHQKRRHIATRYTGVTTAGEQVLLHEGPRGLTSPSVRLFDSVRDTASHKILSLLHTGRLMRYRDDQLWLDKYQQLINSGRPQAILLAFCASPVLNGDRQMSSVVMELFLAGIDYNTGEQYGRALKVAHLDCETKTFSRAKGKPEALPDWPGVEWDVLE